ncbi:MAG TPA: GerAB/ArcD/ProY family transporter [Bacillota bacterium]|nr:GerAB/ArcD/ProY family transporter [Bacillota bacterium]
MKVQITNGMYMALIMNMVYAKAVGLTQGIMAREIGRDIWVATIFSTIQGCLAIALIAIVLRRTPNEDLIGHTQVLMGKWMGKLVALVILVFFIGAYSSVMITYVFHLMDYFLPEMPIVVFVLVAFMTGAYGIFFGIEVISRMALTGVFCMLALNILLLLGTLKNFDVQEMLPFFESGFFPTLWASRQNDTDWAMAVLMSAMIMPTVKNEKIWVKSGTLGVAIGGLLVAQWPLLETTVLSPEVTGQYIVACMQMARSAHIGEFIHRYEMIMVAFFAFSLLVQISMCMYCATMATSKIVGVKDYRRLILPVGFVLNAVAYWVVLDHNRAMDLLSNKWPALSLPIVIGLPLLLWLIGFFFKKKFQKLMTKEGEH